MPDTTDLFGAFFAHISNVQFVIHVEPRGVFRFGPVNEQLLKATGLKAADVIGKTVQEVVPEPSCKTVLKKYREAIRTRQTVSWEETTVYPTGVKHGEVTVTPVCDDKGRVIHLFGVVHDITTRREIEQALQASETRYARAMRAANEGLWERNFVDGKLYLSPRWKSLLGFKDHELASDARSAFYERLHPDDLAVVDKAREDHMLTFKPYTVEIRLRVKSGEYRWFQFRAQAEADVDGKPLLLSGSMVDITERKLTETALRASEARFRAVFEQAAVGVCMMDLATGRYLEVNQRICDFLGRSRKEILRGGFEAVTHPDDIADSRRLFHRLKSGRVTEGATDKRYVKPDGTIVWGHLHAARVATNDGAPDLVMVMVEDITERKLAEKKYQREVGFIETLVNHTSAIIVLLDDRARMIHVNDAVVRMFGYSRAELLNRSPWDVGMMDAAERDRSKARFARVIEGQPNPPREVTLYGKDGTPFTVELTSFATLTPEGKPDRIIVTGNDVTERRRLQKEILRIAEQEQARIGHSLHDGVGQTMTGLVYMIQALEHELTGELRSRAARICEVVQDAVQEVRQMSHGLSPMAVRNRGLVGALRLLEDTVRMNHRTTCVCEIDPSFRLADTEKEAHVYRIAQEAVNNALRHGRAKRITISLKRVDDQQAMLAIEDNGAGFNRAKAKGDGIGLRIMDYRAGLIGGSVEVRSKRGQGTTVICRFPCVES